MLFLILFCLTLRQISTNISMVSRTREKLIEVACQLFAYKGVENTTMSDIANASDRGRRTIYTYFKSKREIYEATLESESERQVRRLREILSSASGPAEKMESFLRYRLEIDIAQTPNHRIIGLDSLLNLDFNRLRRVRQLTEKKESEILKDIISEGVDMRLFDPEQSARLLDIISLVQPNPDMLDSRESAISRGEATYNDNIVKFIIKSILI